MRSERMNAIVGGRALAEDKFGTAVKILAMFSRLRAMSQSDYLFGDLGLEMLLLLLVAERDGRHLSMKCLAIGTATPQTTALRWVDRLAAASYVERREHPSDRRVAHVYLTTTGRTLADAALNGLG